MTPAPTAIPKMPDGITATPTTIPKLPAGTTAALTAVYFYGNGCAACEKAKPLIADIQARYPELHIEKLEVNDNRTNMDTFVTFRKQYGVEKSWFAIPSIFIGKKALVGEPEIKDHFEEYILAEKQRIANRKSP
jgi:thiol-disulfide isomerase/thioredoxin